ncbi:MAG: hypothetical protein WBB45_12770 [Cyclobacteriaceae bacterium]
MFKPLLAVLLFLCVSVNAYSQEDTRPPIDDRIFFGGSFSVNFFNGIFIDVSPLIGYKVTDRFSTGVGVTYKYLKTDQRGIDYSTSIYGGRLFSRYNIYRNFFLHGEYENINLEVLTIDEADTPVIEREWVPGAFAGGGLNQQLGGSAVFSVYVLYNFLHEEYRSPYNSPIIVRVGINL